MGMRTLMSSQTEKVTSSPGVNVRLVEWPHCGLRDPRTTAVRSVTSPYVSSTYVSAHIGLRPLHQKKPTGLALAGEARLPQRPCFHDCHGNGAHCDNVVILESHRLLTRGEVGPA